MKTGLQTESLNVALSDIDPGPSPFSAAGFERYKESVVKFADDLLAESTRVATRFSSDTVSAPHVDRASGYLITTARRKWLRHMGTIGGVFFGAGVSSFIQLSVDGKFSVNSVLIAAACAVIGAFLTASGFFAD